MKASTLLHHIRRFLFGWANREFLIFLFFFALAGIFWLLTTLNESYEQEVRIPIRIVNVPHNVVLTSNETDTLRATVRDKGISLITYLYKKSPKPIDIDFSRFAQKGGTGVVSTNDLLKLINHELPASAQALSVKPEKTVFTYNYGERKLVPVVYQGNVVPDQLYFISNVSYSPDSIVVYAAPEKLDSIKCVYTELLDYKNFRDPITVTTPLQHIAGAKLMPNEVTIHFQTDVLAEVNIKDVEIVGINMPEGTVLRTFPAKVTISFVTGMKNYQSMSAADFLVVADYNEFHNDSTTSCNIYLRRQPDGIQRVKMETERVDYLIEEHKTDTTP